MKILTIVNNLGIGGTERAAQNYSIGYKALGCDVKVLAIDKLGIRKDFLEQKDIEVLLAENSDYLKKLKKWHPQIIHTHRSGAVCTKTDSIIKILKNNENIVLETNVFARPDYSNSSSLVDIHLQLSNWCLLKWSKWTRFIQPKLIGTILPYPVDTTRILKYENIDKYKLDVPKDAIILGRIGQPYDAKWDILIFDVLKELLKKHKNVYLVVVGLPKKFKLALEKYSNEVRSHVIELPTFTNETELISVYRCIDIFVHAANIGESFGMVLAEAMLLQIPIVTLNTPLKDNSQLELIGLSNGGLIANNKNDFAKKVDILIKDKSLRIKLGQNGKEYVKNNFGILDISAKALKIATISLRVRISKELILEFKKNNLPIFDTNQSFYKLAFHNNVNLSSLTRILLEILHYPPFYKFYLFAKR